MGQAGARPGTKWTTGKINTEQKHTDETDQTQDGTRHQGHRTQGANTRYQRRLRSSTYRDDRTDDGK